MEESSHLFVRPRRNRQSSSIRSLVQETHLNVNDFVWPLFVQEGSNSKTPIPSMPGQFRFSCDELIKEVGEALGLGIKAVALFPAIDGNKKDKLAKESYNPDGLLPKVVSELKMKFPEITIVTDVAMDPYSSDGHDGVVRDGKIVNDETLDILGKMALVQAKAGADMVAPSDMMDGRVGHLRKILDAQGYQDVGILSYSAKYASAFYGPFRDALDSAPKEDEEIPSDKKTYQMDPANSREALREILLDVKEGADALMVKPALSYLDIIYRIKMEIDLPLAAYNVSGEYAMVCAAAERGWLDKQESMLEMLLSIKRAGADIIFTYFAKEASEILVNSR